MQYLVKDCVTKCDNTECRNVCKKRIYALHVEMHSYTQTHACNVSDQFQQSN